MPNATTSALPNATTSALPSPRLAPLPVADEEPLYNIGAVGRMTGVPVATLRVWERRYGFPRSVRTPGGHRIFSEREVERVRWVRARIEEGMQAGQAVQALAHVERQPPLGARASGPQVPLAMDAGRRLAHLAPADASSQAASPILAAFRERFSAALRRHDLGAADQILGETLVLFPLEAMILDVVRPALAELGQSLAEGVAALERVLRPLTGDKG
jgi:DNA-binding transcriptional MerR regulator